MQQMNRAVPGRRTFGMMAASLGVFCVLWMQGMAHAASTPAQPKPGGTLTWIVTPEPAVFLPLTTTAGGSAELGPKVVEGLLTYDADLNPLPLLATAWTVSSDGLRYTFTLRQGVKWHDGRDFTAADVAFSILTLKDVHPRGRAIFANVSEVQTPDVHTVVIVLEKPAPYLLTALAATESPIIPKHLYDDVDIVSNPHNSAPIGTGPFVFKEWVKGSHVVLERNPNYWDAPKPYLDRIIARFMPDAVARAAALESGTADLAGQAIPLSDVARFDQMPHLRVDRINWPYLSTHQQLIFNLDTPALQDKRVRQAIAHAIDMQAFNRVVWYGYGTPSAAAIGKASTKYHNADIPFFAPDVKKAGQLLDAAGLKPGTNGVRLTLRLLYNPFRERREADFVRQSLARIGINAVIENYDFATYVGKAYTERAFDITLESLANIFDPTVGVQRVFWSKNFKVGLPFSNAAHYANPQVDRLLEAAAVEIDEQKRRQQFLDFQAIVHEDIPTIEFGADPLITIVSNKVKDYAFTGEGLRSSFADLYLQE